MTESIDPHGAPDPGLDARLRERLVSHYFDHAPRTGLQSMAGTGVLVLAFYLHYRDAWILYWAAGVLGLLLARIAFALHYRRLSPAERDASQAERLAFMLTTALALLYSAGLPILGRRGEDIYNGLLTIWVLMMISGVAFSTYALKRTMLTFCLVLGIALSVRLVAIGTVEYWYTGAGVLLYTFAHVGYGTQSHRTQAEALRQSMLNESLARELEQQVQSALEAERRARQASDAKTRFLATATHDLRQPLHALSIAADSLVRKSAGAADSEEVQVIERAVADLAESVDAMLDLSLLDAGAVQARRQSVSLSEVFADLSQMYAARAARRDLALRFVHRQARVLGDRHLLLRLLSNLVDNALKYTTRGGVLVAVRRRSDGQGRDLLIEVRDSGEGIPADQHERVFDEYYQMGNQDRDRSQGLGLGLSIVRRLASLMDIGLHLRSAAGRGTCIGLYCHADHGMPAAARVVEEQAAVDRAKDLLALRGKRFLVADNEANILRASRELLEPYGVTVVCASTADHAQQLLETESFDMLLLDYRMSAAAPGPALRHLLHSLNRDHGMPVLVLTGDTDSAEIRQLRQGGARIFYKPIRGDTLLAIIRDALKDSAA